MRLQQEIKQPYKAIILSSLVIGCFVGLLLAYTGSGLVGRVYSSPGQDIRFLPVQEWGLDIEAPECQDVGSRSKYIFIEVSTYQAV